MSQLSIKLAGVLSGSAPTIATPGDNNVTTELKTQEELNKEVTSHESTGEGVAPEVKEAPAKETTTEKTGETAAETTTEAPEGEKTGETEVTKTTESAITLEGLAQSIADLTGVVKTLAESKAAPDVQATPEPKTEDSEELLRKTALDEATEALNAARVDAEKMISTITDLEQKAKDAEERYTEIMSRVLPRPDALKNSVELHKLAGFISDPAFSEPSTSEEDGFVGKSQEDFLH